jgi:hypothetical protein
MSRLSLLLRQPVRRLRGASVPVVVASWSYCVRRSRVRPASGKGAIGCLPKGVVSVGWRSNPCSTQFAHESSQLFDAEIEQVSRAALSVVFLWSDGRARKLGHGRGTTWPQFLMLYASGDGFPEIESGWSKAAATP